jgi:hypothetical protein
MRRPHGQQRYAAVIVAAATLLAFAGRAAAGDAYDEAQPLFAAAKDAVAHGRLTQSKLQGFNLGKVPFAEAPDDGGALIGFDIGVGRFINIDNIYALRAVYMTRLGDVTMDDRGLFHDKHLPKKKVVKTQVVETVHVRAKPGYAVGGVTVRSGLNINGLSVTFMRIKGRRLDPNQSYESEWVGDRTGGGEAYLGGDGAPAVGVFGCQDDEKVTALGLVFIKEPAAALKPAVDAPPVVASPRIVPPNAVRPPAKPQVRRSDNPPAPPQADPSPAPHQQVDSTAVDPEATNTPASDAQSPVPAFLVYGLPLTVFLGVAGLILIFALFSLNRKPQPGRRDAKRPRSAQRQRPAPVAPSTALRERSGPTTAKNPFMASDEVLELQPDDYEIVEEVVELSSDELDQIPYALPVPAAAERQALAAAKGGPRLEL